MKKYLQNNVKLLITIVFIVLFLFNTVAYSGLASKLAITSDAMFRAYADIRVTGIKLKGTTGNALENYSPKYSIKETTTGFTLPSKESSITYTVTVTNFGDVNETIYDFIKKSSNIDDVNITVTGYNKKDIIPFKTSVEFDMTFTATTPSETPINYIEEYDFRRVYTVEYNNQDGSKILEPQYKYEREDLELRKEVPQKEGYIFKGWSSTKTSKTAEYKSGSKYTIDKDIILYAIWNVQVNFDSNYMKNDIYGSETTDLSHYNSFSIIPTNKTVNSNTSAKYGREVVITMPSGTIGGPYYYNGKELNYGKKYTWSVYLKASSDKTLSVGHESGGMKSINVTTEWKRYTYTFTANNSGYKAFRFYLTDKVSTWTAGDKLYIHSIELTEGENPQITKEEKTAGETLGTLPVETREGYTFNGWYTDPVGGEKISSETKVSETSTTYYAHYTVNQYTLTVNPNGGTWNNSTSASTVTQNYGTTYTVANPTRTGYTFTGWTLSGKGSLNENVYTYADGAGTLTANWKIDTHTLTINPNGGTYNDKTTNTTVTQNYNSTYGLTTPIKQGYSFTNWTLNSGAKGTLMRGNASGSPSSLTDLFTMSKEKDIDGSEYTNYKVNYTGTTWWPYINFSSYPYISGHTYRISAMIRVREYSGFKYLLLRHSAFHNDYGTTGLVTKGIWVNSDWEEYSLERTFTGTTITQSGTEYTINPRVEIYGEISTGTTGIVDMDVKNLTIYDVTAGTYASNDSYGGYVYKYGTTNDTVTANYKINQYVLTVNPNGGTWNNSTSASTITQDYGTTYTVANPTRTGYTFTGWTLSGKGSISGTTYTYADGAGTLTANWTPNTNTKYVVKHYKQKLDGTYPSEADDTDNLTGTTDSSVSPAVKDVKNNSNYVGFTAPSVQTVTIKADGSTVVTYKYTRNKYTFTLGNVTGVSTSGSTTSGSYYYGSTITLKAIVSAGYTWSKWTSSNTGLVGNQTTANTTFTMPAGAITMTPTVTVNALTFSDQSKTITYNPSSAQNITITGASNGSGNYSYSITDGNTSNYFTISGTTITAKAGTAAGTYTLKVLATDTTTGATKSATITVTVDKKSVTKPTSPSEKVYNTQVQNSGITTPEGASIVTNGSTVSATNAGTYNVIYALNSNYKWSDGSTNNVTVSWKINPYNLSNATISGLSSKTYNGSAQTQNPTVTVPIPSGKTTTLVNGTDFTLSYSNNINAGTKDNPYATMTVTGKGNYTGTKSATFTISQKGSTCTITSVPTLKYPGSTTGTIKYSCTGDGKVTITSSKTDIITVSDATSTSATLTAKTIGTSTITVSQAAGTNYSAATSVTNNVTVTYSTYTVTLNGNGATTNGSASAVATYNSTALSTITNPIRKYTITYNMGTTGITKPNNGEINYTFNGWYTAASNGTKVASNSTTPALEASVSGYTNASKQWQKNGNATLYAGWTQGSTTLATLGKTGNSCSWKDSSGNTYASGKTGFTASSNITLTANCTVNQYVLTVNPNGGTWNNSTSASTVTQNYGTTYTVANPTRTGYTFTGWTLSEKGSISGTTYTFADGAGTLTANWKIDTYSITYNLNGGTVSKANPTSYNVATETITLNNPSKTGYTFNGWTGSNDASSGLSYTSSNQYTANGRDHVLGNDFSLTEGSTYRVFVTGKRVAGSLNLQGGIWYTQHSVGNSYDGYNGAFKKGEDLGNGYARYYKDVSIATGYTKGRFYIQLDQATSGGSTSWSLYDMHIVKVSNELNIPKGSTGNKSYTANYKINQYSLTVNPNGGTWNNSTSASTVTQNYGTTYTVANPTRTGYTFTGWTLSGKGSLSGTKYTYADGAGTLTANWKVNNYTVTFDYNGGTTKSGTTLYKSTSRSDETYAGKYKLPTNPTRPGYDFAGWYTTSTGGTKVTTDTTISTASNHTLYAHWSIKNYTLTVNPNGGAWNNSSSASVITQNYGTTKTITNPTRTGYTFKGWVLTKTIDNSNFVELMYQAPGYAGFTNEAGAKSANTVNLYSQLGQLANFKYNDKYEFIIESDENAKKYRWSQTSNPLTTTSVTGYTNISNGFGGLVYNNTATLLAVSSANNNWWGAIGAYGSGLNPISNADSLWTNRPVHFYVKAANDLSNLSNYTITGALDSSNNYIFRDENVTLQAIWAPNTYTIKYNGNGATSGSIANSTHTYNVPKALTTNAYSRTGYTFAGWSTNSSTTTQINDSNEYSGSCTSNYCDFKSYRITGPFKAGDIYQLDVDVKGSGTLYNYFHGASNYLKVSKVVTSKGVTNTNTDGSNNITLTSNYEHYTVTFTLGSTGDGSVDKYILFRLFSGNSATIKNIQLHKIASNEKVFANGQTVSNLTSVSGEAVNLYALWKVNTYSIDLNYIVDGTTYYSGYNNRIYTGLKVNGVDKGYLADFSGTFDYGTSYEIYGFKLDGTIIPYSKKYTVDGNNYLNISFNTINFASNNTSYGSVNTSSLVVIPGTTFKISDSTITLSDGRVITASTIAATGYTTSLTGFTYTPNSTTINAKTTVTANFTRTANTYTIKYDYNYLDNDIFETTYNTNSYNACCSSGSLSSKGSSVDANGKMYSVTSVSQGWYFPAKVSLTAGKTYTWQLEAKASEATSGSIGSEQNGNNIYSIGTNWTRLTNTFTATSSQYVAFHFYNWQGSSSRTLQIRNAQMHEGSLNTKSYNIAFGNNLSTTYVTPTRAGYTFDGWYTDSIGGTKISSTTSVPSANTTYYAHWVTNKYVYTLGSATGINTSGSTASGSYYYGSTITLKATANAGYTWNKWTSSNTGLVANQTNASSTFTMPIGVITMTPSATVNALTFSDQSKTIKYNPSSKQNIGITGASNGSGNYSYSITDGNTSSYFTISGTEITAKEGIPAGTYALTVKASDTITGASKSIKVTVTVSPADLSGSVKIIGTNTWGNTLTASVTNTNSATLSYQWYYTTNTTATGGTAISGATSSTYVIDKSLVGKNIYVVVTASKTNYNKAAWSDITDASTNGTQGVKKQNLSVTASGVNVKYDANAHYATIKVNSGAWDGKTIVSGTSTSYGSTVTSAGAVGTSYNLLPSKTDGGATTVYYKVTGGTYYFDYAASTGIKINRCTITSTPTLTYPGAKTGAIKYTCTGDGAVTVSSSDTSVITASGTTLTANKTGSSTITVSQAAGTNYVASNSATASVKVEYSKYTVTFNGNGGTTSTGSKSVTYGQTYGTLPTATRSNNTTTGVSYVFEGWYTAASGGTKVTADTKVTITSAQTLYAHWISSPIISGGSASWTSGTRKITLSTTSTSNTTGTISYQYYVSTSNTGQAGGTWTNITSTDKSVEISTAGTHYVYYRAVSPSGVTSNVSNYQTTKIDKTTPSTTITGYKAGTSTTVPSNTWSNAYLNFIFNSLTVGPSGGTIYYCTDTDNKCSPGTAVAKSTAITAKNTTAGIYYVRYKVVSGAGVSSSVGSYTAKVDVTAPSMTLKIYKADADGNKTGDSMKTVTDTSFNTEAWRNYGYYFDLTGSSDSASGIKSITMYTNAAGNPKADDTLTSTYDLTSSKGHSVTSNGNRFMKFVITDNAGNTTTKYVRVFIDTVDPSMTLKIYKANSDGNKTGDVLKTVTDTTFNTETWRNYGYYFDLSESKDNMGIESIKMETNDAGSASVDDKLTTPYDLTSSKGHSVFGNGNRFLKFTVTDKAGNNVVKYVRVFIDTEDPTMTLKIYKADSNGNKTGDALKTVTDTSFNTDAWRNYGYYFDLTGTTDNMVISSMEMEANDAGSVSVDDKLTTKYDLKSSKGHSVSGNGNRFLKFTATDKAGNSTVKYVRVFIDLENPQVTWGSIANKWSSSTTVSYTCKDTYSGFYINNKIVHSASKTATLSTSNSTASASCTDRAGNKYTTTKSYTWSASSASCGSTSSVSCSGSHGLISSETCVKSGWTCKPGTQDGGKCTCYTSCKNVETANTCWH